jgi:hypothetical protein
MSHFDGSRADRVHGFERWNDLTSTENFDGEPALRASGDEIGKEIGASAETGKVLRPSGHHPPFHPVLRDGRGREAGDRGARDARGACAFEETTTFHGLSTPYFYSAIKACLFSTLNLHPSIMRQFQPFFNKLAAQ